MTLLIIFSCITLLGLIGYGFQVSAVYSSALRFSAEKGTACPSSCPPISVLKPLKGLDDHLFDNLDSFCLQEYPQYEIIFALQDHNDPAYKVAKKVKDKNPDKDIRIIVEQCEVGLNPKVNNLLPAYRCARYEHILISDSNVKVDRNYLSEIAEKMGDPSVGLVSNMIKGVEGRSLGSIFENLHLNSFVIGGVCFLDRFLKIPCVVGKSMLMRKTDLEAIGGLKSVKDVLAEDYVLGEKMHKAGKKVILSSYLIHNVNEYWGIKKFLNRHTRWGKLRWRIGGIKYVSELIGNPVFFSCLPLFIYGPTKFTLSLAVFAGLLKMIGDFAIGKKIGARMPLVHYFLAPLKDLIIGVIWFVPIFSSTVVWRGNKYIIGDDSQLSPCPPLEGLSWSHRILFAIKARIA
jgi:ceramide glucosyltransferase